VSIWLRKQASPRQNQRFCRLYPQRRVSR